MNWGEPSATLALASGELHVWCASLAVDPALVLRLRTILSHDEQERADRFVFPRDRERYTVARGLLRHLLARYLGQPPASLRFAYNPYGKPELVSMLPSAPEPAPAAQLRFNLAHSGELALYALTLGRAVGVDLEVIRDDLDYTALLPGIFSANEQTALALTKGGEGRLAFFNGWARKEAVLKARGDGLSYAPDRVEVTLDPAAVGPIELAAETLGGPPWHLYPLEAGPGYTAAAVIAGRARVLRRFRLHPSSFILHPSQ